MNAKRLIVSLVTAVTLTLFGGAAYANQLAAPQSYTMQTSSGAHQADHAYTHKHHGHDR
jgi:hypothetical protein